MSEILHQKDNNNNYRHKETGEIFKTEEDFKSCKGYKLKRWQRDVTVIMPALDLFAKTK